MCETGSLALAWRRMCGEQRVPQLIKARRHGLSSAVWWRQMCEEYKVRQFYTAPTAIRALMKLGDAPGPAARSFAAAACPP